MKGYREASRSLQTAFRDIVFGEEAPVSVLGESGTDLFDGFLQILQSVFFLDSIRNPIDLYENIASASAAAYPADCRFQDIDWVLQIAADRHPNLCLITETERRNLGRFLLSEPVSLERLFVAVGLNHDVIARSYGLDFSGPVRSRSLQENTTGPKRSRRDPIPLRYPKAHRLQSLSGVPLKKVAATTEAMGDDATDSLEFADEHLKGFIQIVPYKKGQYLISGHIEPFDRQKRFRLILPDEQVIEDFTEKGSRLQFKITVPHKIALTAIRYETD